MTNLDIDVMLNAHAGYKDLNGTAQLAWHIDEDTALETIAKKYNIDTNKYTPIGISIGLTAIAFGVSIYLANNECKINGKAEVKSVLLDDLDLKEFRSYLRDMDIRLFMPNEKHNELYQYTGEKSLENI